MKKTLSSKQRAWLSVLGAFLIATGSGIDAALSLFYLPVGADLGFEQATFSLYISIMGLCGVVTMPLVGSLVSRYSTKVKLLGILSGVLGIVCFGCLALSHRLWHFYLGGLLMSLVMPVVSNVLGFSVIAHWFAKKRSFAIAVVSIGCSAGMVLYAQVIRFIIDATGWRWGYFATGAMVLAITVIGSLMLSAPPEHYGLKPYGWTPGEKNERVHGLTIGKALRSRSFWLIAVATLFSGIYISGMQQSLVPMLQVDFRFTAGLAASLMSLYSIVCALAKPLVGIIYEKFGVKVTIVGSGALMALAFLIIGNMDGMLWGVIAMLLLGLGNMYATVILSSYIADIFGNRDYGSIIGYVNIAFTLGVSVGPVVAGRAYDMAGSYGPAYYGFLICVVAAAALTVFADRAAKKHDNKEEAEAV